MIRERIDLRTVGAVHSPDVPGDGVAERREQLAERAVQVEAVAAPTLKRDARRRRDRIDIPALARVDPHRLVRHPLDVRPVEPKQPVDGRWFCFELEPRQVGGPHL